MVKGFEEKKEKQRLVLIDGHSILFRAYHAYPALTTKSGELVNAVYGFTSILLGVIRELEPTHIAVTFDLAEPTFRHKEYEGYKASRPEAPEELVKQLDRVREVVEVLNIPMFAVAGYEADDVIGTLARQACNVERRGKAVRKKIEIEVVIVTGDRDALQLVDEARVFVYTPGRGKRQAEMWDSNAVVKKYGLEPDQLIDYKALAGDSSDEIPGVRGIGPKTATMLLQKFQTLEGIYEGLGIFLDKKIGNTQLRQGYDGQAETLIRQLAERGLKDSDVSESVIKKLLDGKESAKISKRLATIVTDVPVDFSIEECVVHDYDKQKAINKFSELEFVSLISKLPQDTFEKMVQEELF